MKKYLLWLFGITMMLTACNQNNPEQNTKVDDYSYLIESLMRFDDNGEITGYMIGDNLMRRIRWISRCLLRTTMRL